MQRVRTAARASTQAPIQIAVINESTEDDVKQRLQSVVNALSAQVKDDFQPVWGIDADLHIVDTPDQLPDNTWWLVILDNSDVADALGYHDLTDTGLPLGKVFARTDIQNNLEWSVTASHELLEMLADPDINLAAVVEDTSGSIRRLYAYEVSDPCEADKFGYEKNGVLVSDFVYPAWFESFRKKGSTRFDQGGYIESPFQLLPGGYTLICDINGGAGWHQLYPDRGPIEYTMRPRKGSRRERRTGLRANWLNSTAKKTYRRQEQRELAMAGRR